MRVAVFVLDVVIIVAGLAATVVGAVLAYGDRR